MDTEFANYAINQEVITANQVMEVDDGISIMRDPNRCILCRRCIRRRAPSTSSTEVSVR